jgi:hypothetical protein
LIINGRLKRSLQRFASKVGVRLQVSVFSQDNKHGFARINEHAALNQCKQPFSQAGRQVGFKA